jgi:3-hydroxyisobutyrate dehydrogenase-like beta-hydroxyacid dehydrogenase
MTTEIAFIGLGHMGTPIATRLVRAGHRVTVWDRTPAAVEPLVELGAASAPTPSAAVADVEMAMTMLPNADVVAQVLFGPDGVASGMRRGQLYVDMSTIGPSGFLSLAHRLPDGVHAVDAPVRGSVPEATAGTLHIFVGSSDEDFERVDPVLETLGDVRHVGRSGSGQAMKLVVNLTLGVSIVTIGEALALGRALDLKRDAVLDALAESPIGPEVEAKRGNLESGHYPAAFKLSLAYKDMGLIADAASAGGIDLETAASVRAALGRAMEAGAGDLDFSAVVATMLGEDPKA